jgi:parvulin-like peptidyl-prolyl isomerase
MANKKNKGLLKNKNVKAEEKTMVQNSVDENFNPNKKKNSKLYYAFLALVLVVALVYFGVQKYSNVLVVATVNGKPIDRLSFYQRLEKQTGKQVLDQMVSESLIEQEAEKKGVKVADKDIDAKIKELETQFKSQGGLTQVLSLQGMTMSDLRTQLKYNLIVEKIAPKATVSEKEITSEYEKNSTTYGDELTDAVKTQIKNTLLQQKRSAAVSGWFDTLKKSAKISTFIQ